jgi:hypothetical protein
MCLWYDFEDGGRVAGKTRLRRKVAGT